MGAALFQLKPRKDSIIPYTQIDLNLDFRRFLFLFFFGYICMHKYKTTIFVSTQTSWKETFIDAVCG